MPAHPLIFEELTGPDALTVTLSGSALPEEQITEGGKLVFTRNQYPGATEPTIQMLYLEGKPIELTGLLSDRESNTLGFADTMRTALRSLFLRARPIRLLYRALQIHGFIEDFDFVEHDEFECRYRLKFQVTRPMGNMIDPEALRAISLEALMRTLDAFDLVYEDLPEDIRTPPSDPFVGGVLLSDLAFDDFALIPPVFFILDPWLEWRLRVEELHKRVRFLLELAGNESLLNLDDAATAAATAAYVTASIVRSGLDEWDGSALGLVDQITRMRNILAVLSAIQSVQIALGI